MLTTVCEAYDFFKKYIYFQNLYSFWTWNSNDEQRRGYRGAWGCLAPPEGPITTPRKIPASTPFPLAKSNFWTKYILLQGNTESIKVILPVNLLEDNENCSFVWKKFICCVLFIFFA
jgi:hypothetical protein